MSENIDVLDQIYSAAFLLRNDLPSRVRELHAARAAVKELQDAAEHYLEVLGSTHGQPARTRLQNALAATRSQP